MLPHPVAHSIGLLLGDTPFCMRITTQVTLDMYMSFYCAKIARHFTIIDLLYLLVVILKHELS